MDFPITKLPHAIRDAIEAQAGIGNYPVESVGTAALAVVSLAAQGLYNVDFLARPTAVPASLFCLICAPSGGAKSSLFEGLLAGPRRWQEQQSDIWRDKKTEYEVSRRIYEKLKVAAEKGGNREEMLAIEKSKPIPPRSPYNTSSKITTNGLFKSLHDDHPTHGVFTPEGASLLKGYSLNAKNSPEEFGGALASLWSGEVVDRTTGDQRMIIRNRRLSMLVMVQGQVAEEFLSSDMLEAQGALARFLIVNAPAWRPLDLDFTDPDYIARIDRLSKRLEAFHARIEEMLNEPLITREGNDGELQLPTLRWTPAAKQVMRAFQTEALGWEAQQTENWFKRGFEHCVRLAGVLSIFEGEDEISVQCAEAGVELARYYAAQLRKLDVAPVNERHTQITQYIAPAIKKFKTSPDGLTMRDLSRSIWKKMDPQHRERVVEAMINDDIIEQVNVKKGANEVVLFRLKGEAK